MQLQEEKILAVQEKLELSDQKLAQYAKLPEMEEELKQRMEALTQVRAQVGIVHSIIWLLFCVCLQRAGASLGTLHTTLPINWALTRRLVCVAKFGHLQTQHGVVVASQI